jgi:hypothetical protein
MARKWRNSLALTNRNCAQPFRSICDYLTSSPMHFEVDGKSSKDIQMTHKWGIFENVA